MKDYAFKRWNPYTYLNDYFTDTPDFEDTIKFIMQNLRGKNYHDAIDVGCGPTVCFWSAVSNFCHSIDIADYKKSNLNAIQDWVIGKSTFDWSHYSRLALTYKKQIATTKSIQTYETQAKEKLRHMYQCDVFKLPVIPETKQYDLVSTFYCADSISKNKDEWRIAMYNICSLLRPHGTIIGAAMDKCDYYSVGSMKYPGANVSVEDIQDFFRAHNFSQIVTEMGKEFYRGTELKDNHNYTDLIFFSAKK